MYTEEDFKRDYGFIEPGKPYFFPWEKDEMEEMQKRIEEKIEKKIEEKIEKKTERKLKVEGLQNQIRFCKELYEEKYLSEEGFWIKIQPLEQKLQEIQNQEEE